MILWESSGDGGSGAPLDRDYPPVVCVEDRSVEQRLTVRLSDAAIDRSSEARGVCADKLRRRHVSLARSVATEACRRAANARHFVRRVQAPLVVDHKKPRDLGTELVLSV